MREIRTSGATRGEVALRVLPYSTASAVKKLPSAFSALNVQIFPS